MGHAVQCMERPINLPGTCLKCGIGSEDRTYYMDTGLYIDYVGILYLCNSCLGDLVAHAPDFFTRLEMEEVKRDLEFWKGQAKELAEIKFLLLALDINQDALKSIVELRNESRADDSGVDGTESTSDSESESDIGSIGTTGSIESLSESSGIVIQFAD